MTSRRMKTKTLSRQSTLSSSSKERETWNNEAKRRGSFHVIREHKKQRDAQNTTMMLVIVIGLFLLTEIPLLVITVLHTLDNRFTSLNEKIDLI